MKRQAVTTMFCLSTILGGIGNLFVSPVWAETENVGAACDVAITNARSQIVEGRDITIVRVDIRDSSESYPDHPDNRPLIINIALKGSATASVMRCLRRA